MQFAFITKHSAVEPLLRGHPCKRPPSLDRPLDNLNLNNNVLIYTPDECKRGGLTRGVLLYHSSSPF